MSSPPTGGGPPDLVTAVEHLYAGNYVQLSAVIVLLYDHLLTFSDEVERVWKQKLSGVSILFLLNRYGNLLAYIVIIDAFNDASWTPEVCKRFAPYEGAQSLVFIGMVMILRVYALYGRSIIMLAFLMVLWCLQISLSAVGVSTGHSVTLPPGLIGCILVGTHPLFSALWVAPLITDTCIFILTLYRIRPFARGRTVKIPAMMQMFIRDGVVYFFVIFTANIVNCLIYFIAPDEIRTIGASFSQILTSVMISRLILNLRSLRDDPDERQITRSLEFKQTRRTSRRDTGRTFRKGSDAVLDGWSDDAHTGVDTRLKEYRGSRQLWVNTVGGTDTNSSALASSSETRTFTTLATGNFEDANNKEHLERIGEGAVEGRWVVADETALRVMDIETGDEPRADDELCSKV